MQAPLITVFVRHRANCPHRKNQTYKRCNCPKHLRWTEGRRQKRLSARTRSWAGAERQRQKILDRFDAALDPKPHTEPVTVAAAIETFLRAKRGEGVSADTIKRYALELDRLRKFAEQRSLFLLHQVALPDLTDYRAGWSENYKSSRTRGKVQDRLKAFFNFCFVAGFLKQNPAAGLKPIQQNAPAVLPLEREQYEAILKAAAEVYRLDPRKAGRVATILHTMRHTALAIQDAVRLERNALIWDGRVHRVVTARTKTHVAVSIPIPPELAEALRALPNENPRYFFWNTGEGKPSSAVTNWQHDLRAIFRHAGLPQGHPHQLRHTAAVEWLAQGVPLEEVSALLGHDSIKTTQKYYAKWVQPRQQRLDALIVATWSDRHQILKEGLHSVGNLGIEQNEAQFILARPAHRQASGGDTACQP